MGSNQKNKRGKQMLSKNFKSNKIYQVLKWGEKKRKYE